MAEWRITLACGCVYRMPNPPNLKGPYLCANHDGSRLASIVSAERLSAPPVDRELSPGDQAVSPDA